MSNRGRTYQSQLPLQFVALGQLPPLPLGRALQEHLDLGQQVGLALEVGLQLPDLKGGIPNWKKLNMIYRVTIQVVSNLPLTSKQKFHFNMRSLYYNATLVLDTTRMATL